MHRRVACLCVLALYLGTSSATQAAIVDFTDSITLIAAPSDLRQGRLESDTTIYVFPERQNYLAQNLDVDVTLPGTSPLDSDKNLSPGIITDIRVDSFLIHVDSVGNDDTIVAYAGSITFDRDILGIIVRADPLDVSDLTLGFPGTIYPDGTNRDLELAPGEIGIDAHDAFTLSPDRRTLILDIRNGDSIDHLRVVTSAIPEPSSLLLASLGGAALLSVSLRKRRFTSICAVAAALAINCLTTVQQASAAPVTGELVAWGNNDWGQTDIPGGNDFVAVSAGTVHNLALRSDGSIAAWGATAAAPAGNDFIAVSAGNGFSLALKTDGSLVAWGDNSSGQTNVPLGNDFVAISAGRQHSLALKSDGSLIGWGLNDWGQTNVPAGDDFVAVAAGSCLISLQAHSLALKADGSLVGWGRNFFDEATVPAGNDFVDIAAGQFHSLLLKLDGSLLAIGSNSHGQTSVPGGNDFVAIAAGGQHSLALKQDGTLITWGPNSDGLLDTPSGNGFIAISAGYAHSLALRANPVPEPSAIVMAIVGAAAIIAVKLRCRN